MALDNDQRQFAVRIQFCNLHINWYFEDDLEKNVQSGRKFKNSMNLVKLICSDWKKSAG